MTYSTVVIPDGNHASIAIPDAVLAELGGNRRAALRVTINGHTYESTATAVNGECRVVFPSADRAAAGAAGGDTVEVTLELITGYRAVGLHPEFAKALDEAGLRAGFDELAYSHRKEYARAISEAKADDTRQRRIASAIDTIRIRVSGS